MLRIAFVIRKLDFGGAERQLVTLIRAFDPSRVRCAVVTLYAGGGMEAELLNLPHVLYLPLRRRHRWDFGAFWSVLRSLRAWRPHAVHGYMSGSNLLSLLFAKMLGCKSVWGVRISDQDFSVYSRFRHLVHRLEVRASRFADMIIANSTAGLVFHANLGYPRGKMRMISNGVDTERFRRLDQEGAIWRREIGVSGNDIVVLMPARLDPMKDHESFLKAAQQVGPSVDGVPVWYVIMGNGEGVFADSVRALAEQTVIRDRIIWLRADPNPALAYSGSDVVVSSSSFGEGFPNVIAEAMSCGTVVVATAAGDAGLVLGPLGPPTRVRAPDELSVALRAILRLSREQRVELGRVGRDHVIREFSIARLVDRTSRALEEIVDGRDGRVSAE